MNLLAADGDDLFLEILRACLDARAIPTRIARTRRDCFALMRSDPPDLLILESEFAWGPDGVATAMSETPLLRETPVILLTDSHRAAREPDLPPVVARLRKPFRLLELVVAIRMVEERCSRIRRGSEFAAANQ